MIQGPRSHSYLTCGLSRLDVRGDLYQEPGPGYGNYGHVLLLGVLHKARTSLALSNESAMKLSKQHPNVA
jgi:hypothetical protein